MTGLEACQSDPSLGHTLESLVGHLAQAQGKLFAAVKLPEDSAGAIDMMRRAMDCLAQGLQCLQEVRSEAPSLGTATASIARALKTLHPAVQVAREKALRDSVVPSSPTEEPQRVDVQTVLSMNTDHQFYTGFSQDIQEGGIFVATFEPKPKDAQVVVNFKLPGDVPITARGVVQFVRMYNPITPEVPPGMGVRFTDLLSSDKKAIEVYLKSRAPMFYEE